MAKLSDCCGAANRGNGDSDFADYGICPICKEHCEFIEDDDEEDDTAVLESVKQTKLFKEWEQFSGSYYDFIYQQGLKSIIEELNKKQP